MVLSRRSIIMEGLKNAKAEDEIVQEVLKSFPDLSVGKIKTQISANKSQLSKSKEKKEEV